MARGVTSCSSSSVRSQQLGSVKPFCRGPFGLAFFPREDRSWAAVVGEVFSAAVVVVVLDLDGEEEDEGEDDERDGDD